MTATWTEIFPDVDGPPVVGMPGDFQGVQHAFEAMADDAQDALDQFTAITSDAGITQLRGHAADAFERFVGEVADSLGDLPRVSREAATVFASHAGTLDDLRVEVAAALARAQIKWASKRSLTNDLDAANRRVDVLRSQIDSLPPAADPSAVAQNQQLDQDHTTALGDQRQIDGQLSIVVAALAGLRQQWDGFHQREVDLRSTTDHRLDSIGLGALKDPGHFQSFTEGAFDFLCKISGADAIRDLVEAALSGDWAAVLWKLREVLDAVLLVVAVVALFTPLGPLVVLVLVGLAAAKLAIDVTLYNTKWPNPETGEVISMGDVVMSAVGVGMAGFAAGMTIVKGPGLTLLQTGQKLNSLRTETNIASRSKTLRDLGMNVVHARTTGRGWNLTPITKITPISKTWFAAKTGGKVVSTASKAAKAPASLAAPFQSPLSTDVFQSVHDGHSRPNSAPEKIITHLFPGSVQTTACRAA
jgi:hypothetical protein